MTKKCASTCSASGTATGCDEVREAAVKKSGISPIWRIWVAVRVRLGDHRSIPETFPVELVAEVQQVNLPTLLLYYTWVT